MVVLVGGLREMGTIGRWRTLLSGMWWVSDGESTRVPEVEVEVVEVELR